MSGRSIEARFARAVAGAIINADFTDREIFDLSQAVAGGLLQRTLVPLLEALSGNVDGSGVAAAIEAPVGGTAKAEKKAQAAAGGVKSSDQIFDLAKRRKITRSQIFEMMNSINPVASPSPNSDLSIREAIGEFMAFSDKREISFLVDLIENSKGSKLDPFLRGILDRK